MIETITKYMNPPRKLPLRRKELGDPSRKEPGKFLAQYGIDHSKIYGLSLPLPIPDVLCFLKGGRYHFYVAYFNVVLPDETIPLHTYKPLFQPLTRLNRLNNQNPAYFNAQFECVYDYITTVFLEQFFDLKGWKMLRWAVPKSREDLIEIEKLSSAKNLSAYDKLKKVRLEKVEYTEKVCIKGNPYKGQQYPYYCYHPVENEFTFFTEKECIGKKPSQLDFTFDRFKVITFKSPEHFPYIPHSNFVCGIQPHTNPIMDWAMRNQHSSMVRALTLNTGL